MTEARKRNLVQLNLDKVAAHSPSGRRFEEKYTSTESLPERQALMHNAIAHGFMMEESGLLTVLRVLDTEEFAGKDRDGRMAEILRFAEFFAGYKPGSAPPASAPAKPAALTLEAIERELLSDSGVFAKASDDERSTLVAKLVAKLTDSKEQPLLTAQSAAPTPQTPAPVDNSGPSEPPASDNPDDEFVTSSPLPSLGKGRVKIIKGA